MSGKRGRPKKILPLHFVGAPMDALLVYNAQRSQGQKHAAAIEEAVRAVNTKYPDFPFRDRDMRKLLSEAQPSNFPTRFMVTESTGPMKDAELFGVDPNKIWRTKTLSIAPAITHARSNAKAPKKKEGS